MDPHGRLLLEHTAEAVGDARAGGAQAAGDASTGVYVGCMWATGALQAGGARACVRASPAPGTALADALLGSSCTRHLPHPPAPCRRSGSDACVHMRMHPSLAPTLLSTEYVELLPHLGAPDTAAGASTGNTFPFMAGRVSYTYGFQVHSWAACWRGQAISAADTLC